MRSISSTHVVSHTVTSKFITGQSKLIQHIQEFPNYSKPIQTFINLSKPFQTFPDLSKCFQTFPNVSKPSQTFPNLTNPFQTCIQINTDLTKTLQNISKPFRTFPKCIQISSIPVQNLSTYRPICAYSNKFKLIQIYPNISKPYAKQSKPYPNTFHIISHPI